MAISRFYLPAPLWQTEQITLTGDEAAHCVRVLRMQAGEALEVFDGMGRVARALILTTGKNSVQARIEEELIHPAPSHPIHLCPSLIKAEPFEWLLEKAAELGASSIWPIMTARTIVHHHGQHLEKKLIKWRRHMIEAAKQCHTPWVPILHPPLPFEAALAHLPADSLRIMPALSEHARRIYQLPIHQPRPLCVLIGPEGDFTPEEEALACQHGFQPVTLGSLILRAETAAIAALACVAHEVSRQRGAAAAVSPSTQIISDR